MKKGLSMSPSSTEFSVVANDSSLANATPTPIVVQTEEIPSSWDPPRANRLVRVATWLTQIVLALGLGYWIATARSTEDHRISLPTGAATSATDKAGIVPVTTHPVIKRKIERSVEAVGNLHGFDELTLKTKVSGRAFRIHHDFADTVAPGELLLEIDPTDAQLAVEQAKRSLNSELAKWGFSDVPSMNVDLTSLPTVVTAKLRSDWSKSQLSRANQLHSRGSISVEEFEQAKTNAAVAESDYANQLLLARAGAATAQLKKADLDIAEQHLAETKIYVPQRLATQSQPQSQPRIRYRITDRFATEGAWLAVGSEVFRLVIDETLKLRLPIPERYAAQVQVGQRVDISSLTSLEPVQGTVTRISPAIDQATRTFPIEVEVPNADGKLKSGGFAKARVIVDNSSDATTVPTAALVSFAGIHKVFVLHGDTVQEVRVKLGEQTSEWVEIIESEIAEDAEVIVSGHSRLADGSKVRLREAGSDDSQSQSVTKQGEAQ